MSKELSPPLEGMTVPSFCRICAAGCGVIVEVQDNAVVKVTGDTENPMSKGFTCVKGRHLGALHSEPTRFLTAQRRVGPDQLESIDTGAAIAQVAKRVMALADAHGADSIAMFIGTQTYSSSLTYPFATAWLEALGSHKLFTTTTIDQSAKMVTARRLGWWDGGRQRFEDSDVWLLVGTNPLVTMSTQGFPIQNGLRRLKQVTKDGLALIVVDPRKTETAAHARYHLQLRPGTDSLLIAAMLHVIMAERLYDLAFCADHVEGLEALRDALVDLTPSSVESATGVSAGDITEAARVFGHARRGMARQRYGAQHGTVVEPQ